MLLELLHKEFYGRRQTRLLLLGLHERDLLWWLLVHDGVGVPAASKLPRWCVLHASASHKTDGGIESILELSDAAE